MNRKNAWLSIPFLAVIFLYFGSEEEFDAEKAYWNADFSAVLNHLDKQDFIGLPLELKLLWVECSARTANGYAAEQAVNGLLGERPHSSALLAAAATVAFSLGRTREAERYLEGALSDHPASERAVLAKVVLLIHQRRFAEAAVWYEKLTRLQPERCDADLVFLLGLRVYSATLDMQKIQRLYERRAKKWAGSEKVSPDELKAEARLFQAAAKSRLFRVAPLSSEVIIPFSKTKVGGHSNVISYKGRDTKFNLLLDTGNLSGWTIHNPELLDILRSQRGGRVLLEIGAQPGLLEGYSVFTRKIGFRELTITGLLGLYVPKPYPDFYDATLNPAFLQNCVVTLDFAGGRLILRTKDEFEQDLKSQPPEEIGRFPWQGFRNVYLPAVCAGKEALALIETGAQDVALRLDFARQRGLPLLSKTRYPAGGESVAYHETRGRLTIGPFVFEREAAEVWPFSRLSDRISGLTPDVVIGPQALSEGFALSLDPFSNQVILEKR